MENNRKVLQIVSVFESLPSFFGNQFKHFSEKGYTIHFVCSPTSLAEEYAIQQQSTYHPVVINRSFSVFQDLKSLFMIITIIKKNRIDLVVGHTPKAALLSMLAAFLTGVKKRVYFRHGLMFETSQGVKRLLLIQIERLTAFCATKIVCVSDSVYERSLEERLNPKSKQIVLGSGTCNGADSQVKFNPSLLLQDKLDTIKQQYKIQQNHFVVGFLGRLVKDKGIDYLVDAMQFLKTYPDIKLLVIGKFEERDALSESTKEKLKTNPQIIVTGFVDFNEIEYYYASMDVFVLPSFREGFPMSVLEASSMQIPVLTTTVTGCIDSIVDGETGLFIEHDAKDIADKILSLYNDQHLKGHLGKGGRERVVRQYDHAALWPIIEQEVYKY